MTESADDTTDRSLRDTLREATSLVETLEADPVAAVQRRVASRRARRRRATVAAAAAFTLLAAGIVLAIDRNTGNETVDLFSPSTTAAQTGSTAAPTSSPPTSAPPETTLAPPPDGPPLALRADVALAWTGAEVVVWGGDIEAANMGLSGPDRTFAEGAAFNPATRAWRPMAAGPLPAGTGTPVATLADAGVVVARDTATAIWDPGTDTWRAVDDAPSPVTDLVADRGQVLSLSANAVLDVEAGTWRALPEPPIRLERPTTAWTGGELIVIGGPNTPFTSAAAMALDPNENRWRTLPAPPGALHAEALSAAWDGQRVVVVNYDMTAGTYDPVAGMWELLPAVPARFSEWSPLTIAGGGRTVTFMAQAIAVLSDSDRWEALPYGSLPPGQIVRLGGPVADGGPRGAIWGTNTETATNVLTFLDPDTLLSTTQRRQVGAGSIELAPGETLRDARFEVQGGSLVETVKVTVATAEGDACTISSTYLGSVGPAIDQPAREELPSDNGPRAWFHDTASVVWETEASTSDLFRITCDNPVDARRHATTARFT